MSNGNISFQQREEEIRRERAERLRMLQEWHEKPLEPQEEDKSNWITDFAGNLTLGTALVHAAAPPAP